MHRSRRLDDIQPFHVMELLRRARELEAHGRDIIDLINGRIDPETLAQGENVKAYIAQLRAGGAKSKARSGFEVPSA